MSEEASAKVLTEVPTKMPTKLDFLCVNLCENAHEVSLCQSLRRFDARIATDFQSNPSSIF